MYGLLVDADGYIVTLPVLSLTMKESFWMLALLPLSVAMALKVIGWPTVTFVGLITKFVTVITLVTEIIFVGADAAGALVGVAIGAGNTLGSIKLNGIVHSPVLVEYVGPLLDCTPPNVFGLNINVKRVVAGDKVIVPSVLVVEKYTLKTSPLVTSKGLNLKIPSLFVGNSSDPKVLFVK